MRLGTLTALDLVGLRPRRQADGSYHHRCVACGGAAKTGNWHTQCGDPSCPTSVFSPLDLLASKSGGDYRKAADFANDQLQRKAVTGDSAESESVRRKVVDFWLNCCRHEPNTTRIASQTAALKALGWLLLPGQRGVTVLSGATIGKLVELADETGATFPDSMRARPPTSALAYVVQTVPHTIDRIVITSGRDQECHVIWRKKRVGLVGMIGMRPVHLLAPDYRAALSLQRQLSDLGQANEVAAVFTDREGSAFREEWRPDLGRLVSVVESAADVVTFAAFYEAFPLATDCVTAMHRRRLTSVSAAAESSIGWSWMRRSYLAAAIGSHKRELSSAAIHLLEKSHPTREEIAWLIQRFREHGKFELAEDIKRHMDNRVIASDGHTKIREAASEYLVDHGHSTSTIANFALQFVSNLYFRDSVDVFHKARLMYGRSSVDVVIGAHAVDNPGELQKTIRHQMLLHRGGDAPDQLPTIIDTTNMRRHVIPYFKHQVSRLPAEEGFRSLGWSEDRSLFVGPGVRVTMGGRTLGPVPRHPGVAPLRHFRDTGDWEVGFASDLPVAARDLVAMTLASCVRFYVKGVTRPVCVQHSPEARHLLKTMFGELGQTEIFELNPNVRDQGATPGVRGYPFLVTGYNTAQAVGAKFGHVLLTDSGYCVNEEIDQEVAEAAGRSLKFGLLRVVEWCIAVGADTFSEIPALHFNSSLLREGKWLVENVCDLQPWEVSDLGLINLEELLTQIPFSETSRRLSVKDGTRLTADLSGLAWDRDKVRGDLAILRSYCEGEGDTLEMGAVEVLPALGVYYGQIPEVAVVM